MWNYDCIYQCIGYPPPYLVAIRIHSCAEFGLDAYPKVFTACKGRENLAGSPATTLIAPPTCERFLLWRHGPAVFVATWRAASRSKTPRRDSRRHIAPQNTPARFAKTIRHASKRRSVPRRYVFEKWNCIIKKSLPERKGKGPLKRLNPDENFTEVSLLEYGDLKPILLFLGGRSDAACRIVIPLYAVPH